MPRLLLFFISLFAIFLVACSKPAQKPSDPPIVTATPLDFTFIFPDSIYFDNKKKVSVPFECKRIAGNQNPPVTIWTNGSLPAGVSSVSFPSGQLDFNGNWELDCTDFNPGIYSFTAKASSNDGVEKNKSVYIVMRPACSYDFNKPLNVKKTTFPNGAVTYSTAYTSYNLSNNLIITQIFIFPIELIFDCSNKTVQMTPVTNGANNYTAAGTFNNTTIYLDLYNNLNLMSHLELTK